MYYRGAISILLLSPLLPTFAAAQNDATENDFSLGAVLGAAFSLSRTGLAPRQPAYVMEEAPVDYSFATTATYRIIDDLALELAVDYSLVTGFFPDKGVGDSYPEYIVLENKITAGGILFYGGGISWRVRLGAFLLEPTMLAGATFMESAQRSLFLKKSGSNEYRTTRHDMTSKPAFTLSPALTVRLPLESSPSTVGAHRRISYLGPGIDVDHSLTEETLIDPSHTSSLTARHDFSFLNVGLGFYWSPF